MTSDGEAVFDWVADALVLRADAQERLVVADSWLVAHGRVRQLAWHRARFLGQCAAVGGGDVVDAERFWGAAVGALPRTGTWFPRVELLDGRRFRLRLRPAPPLTETASARFVAPDPRTAPTRKGPDIPLLAAVRAQGNRVGAEETVITLASGLVLEATGASLLWWEGDELHVPSADLPVLAGVTTRTICERARREGVVVRERHAVPLDLDGRETWLVNALHGIRPVREWIGTTVAPGSAVRAPAWRAWLATDGSALDEVP